MSKSKIEFTRQTLCIAAAVLERRAGEAVAESLCHKKGSTKHRKAVHRAVHLQREAKRLMREQPYS
jgi:hypothetical protein